MYVTQLHGVWVHSSSLLLPRAGDPPPPALATSPHRYPRCPQRHWLNTTVQMLQPEEEDEGGEPPVCVCTLCVCASIHMHLLYALPSSSLHRSVYIREAVETRWEETQTVTWNRQWRGGKRTKYCRSSSTTGTLLSSLFSLSLSLLHPSFNLHASSCFSVRSRPGGRRMCR